LYFLYYIKWLGSSGEFERFLRRLEKILHGIKGIKYLGVFAPSSEWNFVFLFETADFDNGLGIYREYMNRNVGESPFVEVGKLELLFTLEEIGWPK
jgi:hypothetical protein